MTGQGGKKTCPVLSTSWFLFHDVEPQDSDAVDVLGCDFLLAGESATGFGKSSSVRWIQSLLLIHIFKRYLYMIEIQDRSIFYLNMCINYSAYSNNPLHEKKL